MGQLMAMIKRLFKFWNCISLFSKEGTRTSFNSVLKIAKNGTRIDILNNVRNSTGLHLFATIFGFVWIKQTKKFNLLNFMGRIGIN